MVPPEVTGVVVGAMTLAALREQGKPEPVAVQMALRMAYASCVVAALMGGGA